MTSAWDGSTSTTSSMRTEIRDAIVPLGLEALEEVRAEHLAVLEHRELLLRVGDLAAEERLEALGDGGHASPDRPPRSRRPSSGGDVVTVAEGAASRCASVVSHSIVASTPVWSEGNTSPSGAGWVRRLAVEQTRGVDDLAGSRPAEQEVVDALGLLALGIGEVGERVVDPTARALLAGRRGRTRRCRPARWVSP